LIVGGIAAALAAVVLGLVLHLRTRRAAPA
jgi:hypothetical protein